MSTPKILTLDLETSPLLVYTWGLWQQNVAINQIVDPTRVISWAAKWHDKAQVLFGSEHHHGAEEMIQRIYNLVDEADVVVHFNGGTFDMPHLRREFSIRGFAPYSPAQEIDLLKVVKNRFRFPSNKLDYVSRQFGLGGKVSHTGFDLWKKCLQGDDQAWSLMRKYNKGDVIVTEQLYDKLRPFIKNHPHMGLYSHEDCCQSCGGTDLERRGYAYTPTAVFQRYRCRACGLWSRSGKSVDRVDARGVA